MSKNEFDPGDIVYMDLNPVRGHEQKGYRPVVIVNNKEYKNYVKLAIVCPISNTDNGFPLHIPLDKRTATTGFVLSEHVRTVDLATRNAKFIEKIPDDILQEIKDIIISSIK